MENEAPRELDPVLLRIDRSEARLDVRTRSIEPKALGHASDVAVDGHRRHPKGRSEDDRCRLATHSMQPREPIHVRRHLATELLEKAAGHPAKRLRLLVVEPRRLDIPLEDSGRRRRVVRRATVLGEEDPGDLVDPLVLGLRRQDRRHEQLQRRRETERGSPVRIGLREAGQDLAGARTEHRIRAHGRAGLLPLGPRGHR